MVDSSRGRSGLRLKRFGRGGAIDRIERAGVLLRISRGRRKDGGSGVRVGSLGGMMIVVDTAFAGQLCNMPKVAQNHE